MRLPLLTAAVIALAAGLFTASPADAASRREIHQLRQACDHGSRRACVQLGRAIEERQQDRREWRRERWRQEHRWEDRQRWRDGPRGW